MPSKTTTVRLAHGMILPDASTIRALMKELRTRADKDRSLGRRWRSNPRAVLAELGLARPIQNQILSEEGLRVVRRSGELQLESGCYSCSGCCCTGCSYSG